MAAAKVTSACWHAVSSALRSSAVRAVRSFPCADPPRVHARAARHVMLHIASNSILTATIIMMIIKTPDGACTQPHGEVSGREGRRHRQARRRPRLVRHATHVLTWYQQHPSRTCAAAAWSALVMEMSSSSASLICVSPLLSPARRRTCSGARAVRRRTLPHDAWAVG